MALTKNSNSLHVRHNYNMMYVNLCGSCHSCPRLVTSQFRQFIATPQKLVHDYKNTGEVLSYVPCKRNSRSAPCKEENVQRKLQKSIFSYVS